MKWKIYLKKDNCYVPHSGRKRLQQLSVQNASYPCTGFLERNPVIEDGAYIIACHQHPYYWQQNFNRKIKLSPQFQPRYLFYLFVCAAQLCDKWMLSCLYCNNRQCENSQAPVWRKFLQLTPIYWLALLLQWWNSYSPFSRRSRRRKELPTPSVALQFVWFVMCWQLCLPTPQTTLYISSDTFLYYLSHEKILGEL